MSLKTDFAPAERASDEEVLRQYKKLAGFSFVNDFLDAVPHMTLILNRQRQIVFSNRAFLDFSGERTVESVLGRCTGGMFGNDCTECLGQRPGEWMGCKNASLTEGGCGTTGFCRFCGAVQSIMNSQSMDRLDVQECRMVCGSEKESLDLRVWSRPIRVNEEPFTVFSVVDISDEKRRQVLERIFFHDILNTAGGVKSLADLLIQSQASDAEVRELAELLSESADQLLEEIASQRSVVDAERGDLKVSPEKIGSVELLNRVVRQFRSVCTLGGKSVVLDAASESCEFSSDAVLVRRVLVNLVKNALEASSRGGVVKLACRHDAAGVCFTVHNAQVMPEEVRLQVFNRSFSTKGRGRGIGTYSVKLITEKYLKGQISFVSSAMTGTLFTVCYPLQFNGEM